MGGTRPSDTILASCFTEAQEEARWSVRTFGSRLGRALWIGNLQGELSVAAPGQRPSRASPFHPTGPECPWDGADSTPLPEAPRRRPRLPHLPGRDLPDSPGEAAGSSVSKGSGQPVHEAGWRLVPPSPPPSFLTAVGSSLSRCPTLEEDIPVKAWVRRPVCPRGGSTIKGTEPSWTGANAGHGRESRIHRVFGCPTVSVERKETCAGHRLSDRSVSPRELQREFLPRDPQP